MADGADIGTIANNMSVALGSYTTLEYPVIALAFGFCTLKFSSTNAAHDAGNVHTLTMGDYSVKVTLNKYGRAEVSLLPFIRAYMADDGTLALPLESDGTVSKVDNAMRGVFALEVSEANSTDIEQTINIHYIYGTNQLQLIDDKWLNLNTGDILGTWVTLDYFADNDEHGVPTDDSVWVNCNYNINRAFPDQDQIQVMVTQYRGNTIVNGVFDYHFIEDCRVDGVRAVKWLDKYGGMNIRKLTFAGESIKAAHSDQYNRPHVDRNVSLYEYYHGDDMWETLTPTTTCDLGDDGIPMELFDWLSGLATSPVVELYNGAVDGSGKWVRCNIGDVSIERDPRKSTFSLSLSLIVPSDMVQQF